jgi:hypothetical protein
VGFNCGIVGLPNVGKSTLFNALIKSNKAKAANYPFATIEPNVGRVAVPDKRLQQLSKIGKSEKTIPTYIDFIDIAGLVKGASTSRICARNLFPSPPPVEAPLTRPAISIKSM